MKIKKKKNVFRSYTTMYKINCHAQNWSQQGFLQASNISRGIVSLYNFNKSYFKIFGISTKKKQVWTIL